jgi:glycerol-3-phosphate acyltransferase PlsY
VLRSGNQAAAVATLLLSTLKGYAPVLLAVVTSTAFRGWVGGHSRWSHAAFLGHLWPEKCSSSRAAGVATAAGVLKGINPWLRLATLVTWMRHRGVLLPVLSSLAAIVAAVISSKISPSC